MLLPQPRSVQLLYPATLVTAVAVAYALVQWPYVTSGAVFGAVILWAAMMEPLLLIGVMLGLGALDLSFLTGGFKALFQGAGGLDMNGIRLVGMIAAMLAILATDHRVQAQTVGKAGRYYLVFLLWLCLGLLTSYAPLEGLRLLFKLAYPFLTFIVVAGVVEDQRQLDRLMAVTLLTGAAVVIAINPLFVLGGGYEVDYEGFRRIRGVGTHENPFSFYLLVILLISFGRFITRGQIRYVALCGMLGAWIVLTLTRITLAALFAGLGAMMLLVLLEGRNRRAIGAGALIAVGIGIPFIPPVMKRTLGYVPSLANLLQLVQSPLLLYESMNWQGREVLWAILYKAFRADIWTGYGIGSSSVIIRENFPASAAQVAHNEYLRLAVDSGVIGVGLFFLAILCWLLYMIKLGWRADDRVREFTLPAVGAIIGWAFISITDNAFDYYGPYTQYVGFLCGGALAASRLCKAETSTGALAPVQP